MKDRPEMELVGHDGNIFGILGRASRLLKQNGLAAESKEMFDRTTSCHSYDEALNIISEYVQTELSGDDHGILEAEDVEIDWGMIPAEDGVTAYVETRFDVERRFGFTLGPDESVDLYATVQPETGAFSASIIIKHEPSGEHELRSVKLLPSEQKLITDKMEAMAKEDHTSLSALYAEWKSDNAPEPTKSNRKEKKAQHDR